MRLQKGLIAKEKLSTNLNERYFIPNLDRWIINYSELPDKDKISIDIKHLTSGDLLDEFKDIQNGGHNRHAILTNDKMIFLTHSFEVHGIEDENGKNLTEPMDLTKVGYGDDASLCAFIMKSVVDHLYECATLTEQEVKNL